MDTETFVLAHVTKAVIWYSMGYPDRAATEFRASMPNDTREEVYLACRSLARLVIKYKELPNPALGDPWCVADVDPYSQNRAQGWAAQLCVAVGNENNVRATALFDSIRSPQQASENMAALFRMAGELAKEHYERESR